MSKRYVIYEILNTVTGTKYVGSTRRPDNRESSHFSKLRKNIHANSYLQNAWNKYGPEAFEFSIVKRFESEDDMRECEQEILNKYITEENWSDLYNIGINVSNYEFSEETREKLAASGKRRIGAKNPFFGKIHSDKTKEAISKAKVGTQTGSENHFFGKTHSEESKRKISEKKTGTQSGEDNPSAKLTKELVRRIHKIHRDDTGLTKVAMAKMFGVTDVSIRNVLVGKTWKAIYKEFNP